MVNNRSDATILPPSTWGIIEFITPNIRWRNVHEGPADTWDYVFGYIAKSTDSPSYELNFPTTGADGLHFDFIIRGDATGLTWDSVTHEGITATVTPQTECNYVKNWIDDCYIVYRVKLTGPHGRSQWYNSNPSPITVPRLPQTFELVGRDSNGEEIIKYGFVLRQWFISKGFGYDTIPNLTKWCNRLGYHMPQVKDLTNAKCGLPYSRFPCVKEGVSGGTPSSKGNRYMRAIGAGIAAEWGDISLIDGLGLNVPLGNTLITSDTTRSEDGYYDHYCFSVYMQTGSVNTSVCHRSNYTGFCITP